MSKVESGRITYGQVFHVVEEPVGEQVRPGEVPQAALEPASQPERVIVTQDTGSWLDEGEALLAAAEACDLNDDSDHDAYHEATLWFYENARELLDAARQLERLEASLEKRSGRGK